MKAKVSTEWLSGCSGCHVAIVDLHEKLVNLADEVEFVRIPVLMDEKGYPKADIGIAEGAIRSEHDREAVLKLRDSVKTLVAFGSCAAFGGPSGLGWLHDRESTLAATFDEGASNAGGERPQGAPKLEDSVIPIDEVVTVDYYLPGCPPSPYFIASAIKLLADGQNAPVVKSGTVCGKCVRKMKKATGVALQKGAITAKDDQVCFLSQGVVCMGSVTLDRCLSPCPKSNVVCVGCNGPSIKIIQEPHLDLRTEIAKRMNHLCGIPEADTRAYLQEDAKTFYSYAMASPVMFKKPTVELREWAGGK
jgi:F420-non-reducing hydrogenase small subunit